MPSSRKELTKIFGSKHPAIECLSTFVYCSSMKFHYQYYIPIGYYARTYDVTCHSHGDKTGSGLVHSTSSWSAAIACARPYWTSTDLSHCTHHSHTATPHLHTPLSKLREWCNWLGPYLAADLLQCGFPCPEWLQHSVPGDCTFSLCLSAKVNGRSAGVTCGLLVMPDRRDYLVYYWLQW